MRRLDATSQAESASKPHPDEFPGRRSAQRSSKILDLHLDRLAIVYVRQSDPQQVLNHRESRERQYELVEHSVALGWPRDRVVLIDDDQGKTGRTAVKRGGFHRLLAEVTMEHVGLILGIEMSRIARNNRDWHNLLEMCAVFGTILADEDGVYDPKDTNDRLLLGLKGGATYPTTIPFSRPQGEYPRGSPPRCRRPVRHRDGLLLEGGRPMARPATARRPADGRAGRLDRPARRGLRVGPGSPDAVGPRPAGDGPALPAAPARPFGPTPAVGVTPDALWALLPPADRERFGLRLSRLVLRAIRDPDPEEDG